MKSVIAAVLMIATVGLMGCGESEREKRFDRHFDAVESAISSAHDHMQNDQAYFAAREIALLQFNSLKDDTNWAEVYEPEKHRQASRDFDAMDRDREMFLQGKLIEAIAAYEKSRDDYNRALRTK